MKVLISGICGNIGRYVAQQLVVSGHHVRGLDLPTPRNRRVSSRLGEAVDMVWGDVRDPRDVMRSIRDQDVVIHLAFILPPASDDNPQLAEEVNIAGTHNMVAAAKSQLCTPQFLFASTFNVFGCTQHLPPPRTLDDPVTATDPYTRHKLAGEHVVRTSGLQWAIYRFATVPQLAPSTPHSLMFRIPLETRIELLHPIDAGFAIAQGIQTEAVWDAIWLIGGGPACQVRYRNYLNALLGTMGIDALPEGAFGQDPYCTDWLETTASESLLKYQRHTFEQIVADVSAALGPLHPIMPLLRPLVRRRILSLSPYHRT